MNLGVDIGGTFTDLVAYDPASNETVVSKALNRGFGPREDLLSALGAAGIEADSVETLTHGTTAVTNLLIERTGAKVGLLTTRGFRDVLEIQLSYRERSVDISYVKTPPTVPRHLRLELGGRMSAAGAEVEPIDEAEVERAVRELLGEGVDSLTVALYNSYANPAHERQVADVVRRVAPDLPLTLSTDVDRRIGEFERVSTAVLNAMAVPRMQSYVDDLGRAVRPAIQYMHSGAGVLPPGEARLRPIQLAFSGPAAGVLAGREVARQLGYANAITMDMGGTSCDVALIWDGEFRFRTGIDIEWGVPARIQSVDVATIGAGGGSICHRDAGGALRVGPRSAGAVPGPACYGRGGTEATVTDANLVLGIVSPRGLLGGSLPLDADAAQAALERLGREFDVSGEEASRGAYAIVGANMAQAIREITVRKGLDPRECALVAFGGAGAQHAAAVAEQLGVRDVVIPVHGSVLSAVGLLTAATRITSASALLLPLEELGSPAVERVFSELEAESAARLGAAAEGADVIVERFVGLRYVGQTHEVPVASAADPEVVRERFETDHERLFGTRLGDPIETVDCWVTLTVPRAVPAGVWRYRRSERAAAPEERRVLLVDDVVDVHDRGALDGPVEGPCLVEEEQSVTWVPEGATARPVSGHLVVELPA